VKFSFFKPKPPHRRNKVLFVDADGAALSVMACAFAKAAAPKVEVAAAGLHPMALRPETVKILSEKGLTGLAGVLSVSELLNTGFDTVITIGAAAATHCPNFGPAVDRLHWGVDDPVEKGGSEEEVQTAYRKTRDDLEKRVKVFFGQMK